MRLKIDAALDYVLPEPANLLLAIEAAQLPDQRLVEDRLIVDGSGPLRPIAGENGIGRRTWMRVEGAFKARYSALVEIERTAAAIDELRTTPLAELPPEAVAYLWPSRYCEADRFETFVAREFPTEATGAKLLDMARWIHDRIDYRRGSSNERTTAVETFVARQGVCRDFAHLLVAFARAAGVPARVVSAYAWRLDPPDFHAVVEVWLDGAWHLIDPTGLAPIEGLVRIGVGRDATDVAFMTVFGTCELNSQSVSVKAV